MYKLLTFHLLLFIFTIWAGKVIKSNSCSQSDVQNAINQSLDGDTVEIAKGECGWREPVIINKKSIVLRGKSEISVITDPVAVITDSTVAEYNKAALLIYGKPGKPFRVTNISFKYNNKNIANAEGLVQVNGITGTLINEWRIDHCKFILDSVKGTAISVNGMTYGVIDNCYFKNCRINVAEGPVTGENASWQRPLTLGSDSAVYIEDCTFKRTIDGNVVDNGQGARYVFRNNNADGGWQEAHGGCQCMGRSSFSVEVYNNQITSTEKGLWAPMGLGGGTGVWFGNRITGQFSFPNIVVNELRSCASDICLPRGFNLCDGTELNKGNTPDGNIPDLKGHHTGAPNPNKLSVDNVSWASDEWIGCYLKNFTDGSGGEIIANNSNEITATLTGGKTNTWNRGDSFQIISGYPCWDQIGRSTDRSFGTEQNHEPLYEWDNLYNGKDINIVLNPDGCPILKKHIKEGRDYFNDTPRPGYNPYQYPHPVRLIGVPPLIPRNIRICSK